MSSQAIPPEPLRVPFRALHASRSLSSLDAPTTTRRPRGTLLSKDSVESRIEQTWPDKSDAQSGPEFASSSINSSYASNNLVPDPLFHKRDSSSEGHLPSSLRGSSAYSSTTTPRDHRSQNQIAAWDQNQITTISDTSADMKKPRPTRATLLREQTNKQTAESSSTSISKKPAAASSSSHAHRSDSKSTTRIASSSRLRSSGIAVRTNAHMGPRKSTSPGQPINDGGTKIINPRQQLSATLVSESKSSPSSRLPQPAAGLGRTSTSVPATRRSKLSTGSSNASVESLPMIEESSVFESVAEWNSQVDDSDYHLREDADVSSDIAPISPARDNASDVSQIGISTTGHFSNVNYQVITELGNSTKTIDMPIGEGSRYSDSKIGITGREYVDTISNRTSGSSKGNVRDFIAQIGTPMRNQSSTMDSHGITPSGSFMTPIQSSYGFEVRERRGARDLILGPEFVGSTSAAGGSEEVLKSRVKRKGAANASAPRAYPPRVSSLPGSGFEDESSPAPAQMRAQSAAAIVSPIPASTPGAKRKSTLFKPTAASSARKSAAAAQLSIDSIATASSTAASSSGRLGNFVRKSRESIDRIARRRTANRKSSTSNGGELKNDVVGDSGVIESADGEAPAVGDGVSTGAPLEATRLVGNVAGVVMTARLMMEGDEELLANSAQQLMLLPGMLTAVPRGNIRSQLARIVSATVLANIHAREDLDGASSMRSTASSSRLARVCDVGSRRDQWAWGRMARLC